MKKDETRIREEELKAAPQQTKADEKMVVQSMPRYANEPGEDVKEIHLRPPRRTLARNQKGHEQMVQIRQFLSHTEWKTEADEKREGRHKLG